jgi:tRNA A37 threonylcarbamoyladenosine synthetase subunit TsaC/SUA5/YrdC
VGGFHLAVDAGNSNAVRRLRDRKHRVEKPIAVMVKDEDAAALLCAIGETERRLLAAVEILAQPEANHASLIVMGAADYSMFDSITRDRAACRVLAHAHCPILSRHGAIASQELHQHQACGASRCR